ncbi:MAG: response regulator [Magnetococcales bacterium]|nr:response regulator [Magnetococcales bacterium]
MADSPADARIAILLVDDQPVSKVLLGRMLATQGGENMVLHYVSDPLMAEERVQEMQPTVILLDLMMPGLDGLDLLRRFRQQAATQDVPIVMLSAVEDPQQKAAAFALGANDFVLKLPDRVEMLARLRHHASVRLAQLRQQQSERALALHRNRLEEMVKERTLELFTLLATHKEQEAYSRAILENALDAIISVDAQGLVVDFNPAAEVLFGYTAAEVVGHQLDRLIVSPEWRANHQTALAHHAESTDHPQPFRRRVDLSGRCKDGQVVDLEAALTLTHSKGQLYFTGFLHDITRRKQLLKSLEETLTVAQSANRIKGEFIANISHEIRTPMNAIIGFTELALKDDLSSKLRSYLGRVRDASHALMGLINDILDFSKLGSGKFRLDPVEFVLSDLFDHLAGLFSKQVADRGIELLFVLPPEYDEILFGDDQRLRQVLINLIGNALKFTESGTVVVRLASASDRPNPEWHFSVQDTGIGIDPQRLPQLFEPFVQADGSTTRKYGGTGIGLTISKQLVEMMGGRIRAESVLGKGSVFHFTVPLARRTQEGNRQWISPAHLQGQKVLIVDDNPLVREMVRASCAAWALCPTAVGSWEDALTELMEGHRTSQPYTLALLDWRLPDMDGITLARKMVAGLSAESPSAPQAKVIMMVDFGWESLRKGAQQAGVDLFLDKPFTCALLLQVIQEVLRAGDLPRNQTSRILVNETAAMERLCGARILVVDDNVINQEIASALLTQVGLRVVVVNDGVEAVARVQQESFDGILMDVQMPRMNGYEATRRIRAQARCRDLPIIAMTAHAIEEEQENCLQAGMNACLVKPMRPERLYGLLIQWIGPGYQPAPCVAPSEEEGGPDLAGIDVAHQTTLPPSCNICRAIWVVGLSSIAWVVSCSGVSFALVCRPNRVCRKVPSNPILTCTCSFDSKVAGCDTLIGPASRARAAGEMSTTSLRSATRARASVSVVAGRLPAAVVEPT